MIVYKTGDTTPELTADLFDGDTPTDLTGATIVLVLARRDGSDLQSYPMTGAGNEATANFEDSDLEAGLWRMEYQVTFADGETRSYPSQGYDLLHVYAQLEVGS